MKTPARKPLKKRKSPVDAAAMPPAAPAPLAREDADLSRAVTAALDQPTPAQTRPQAAPSAPAQTSHVRGGQPSPATPSLQEELAGLPADVIVFMRRSGGLRFTTREVAIFKDGRVMYRNSDAQAPAAQKKTLTAPQLKRLTDLVARSGIARFRSSAGRQNPDGYAYELAARNGAALAIAEVFDGSVPESFRLLIAELNAIAV